MSAPSAARIRRVYDAAIAVACAQDRVNDLSGWCRYKSELPLERRQDVLEAVEKFATAWSVFTALDTALDVDQIIELSTSVGIKGHSWLEKVRQEGLDLFVAFAVHSSDVGLAAFIAPERIADRFLDARPFVSEDRWMYSSRYREKLTKEAHLVLRKVALLSTADNSAHRIRVDVEAMEARLDGAMHRLDNEDAAKFLAVVAEKDGHWVSMNDVLASYPELELSKPSRLKDKLPKIIQDALESSPAKGTRVRKASG
jgi:hypothetical protein